jgi:DNA ligase-1
VALQSRVAQKMLMMPPKLTIEKVFADMKFLAHASGKDSQKAKKERIQKMLVASRGEEAKFIVRMLQAKLRIGIQIPTLLQALAYAFVLTVPAKENVQAVADVRKGAPKLPPAELEVRMCTMEASVKRAFSEMPNFDRIVASLLEGCDGNALLRACHISLGIPVKPMLAKPSKGIPEVVERLSGKRFTGEYKYDGERAQIHVISRDVVQIYSRNSENMTEKYPDVIKTIKESLCEGVESCIIDSELVAFDQTEKRILPFQILTTRGRKNITIENIKVHVCIYAFDCMLCNGQPLVKETLEDRRTKLRSLLKETEGLFVFASYRDFDELKEEEIQAFLDESVGGSCEGLMLKTLTDNATYEPSKRSLNWLKLKKDYIDGMGDSIDVVPIGAFYGKGKRTGAYGAFLLAIYDPEAEEFQTVCKAGTGFSDEDLTTHHEFFKSRTLAKADINYNVTDKVQPDVWLEACQVWEIRAADLSISPVHTGAMGIKADGKGIGLRFPRFLRIREDKSPEESTGPDQIVEMFEAQASVSKDGGGGGDDDF